MLLILQLFMWLIIVLTQFFLIQDGTTLQLLAAFPLSIWRPIAKDTRGSGTRARTCVIFTNKTMLLDFLSYSQ